MSLLFTSIGLVLVVQVEARTFQVHHVEHPFMLRADRLKKTYSLSCCCSCWRKADVNLSAIRRTVSSAQESDSQQPEKENAAAQVEELARSESRPNVCAHDGQPGEETSAKSEALPWMWEVYVVLQRKSTLPHTQLGRRN